MGWSRHQDSFLDLTDYTDKVKRGASYKLCPWSTAYRELWRYDGEICVGYDSYGNKIMHSGALVVGNSTNDQFFGAYYVTYECSEHTTTSGRMIKMQNPPGWVCDDPNCCYFTTIASGTYYSEV
jgi:hypothetical protein